jgi:arylsulfatase A-like enzyme
VGDLEGDVPHQEHAALLGLLAKPLPEMPVPNDLATRLDVDSPTGRRVNASLAGATLPRQTIDGHDIRPLLMNEAGARSPTDEKGFFYYHMDQLQAVRSGPWKLYLPLKSKRGNLSNKREPSPLRLFNVREDVREEQEMSAQHPDIVAHLTQLAEAARREIGDDNQPGSGQRPAGHVENTTARVP